MKKLTFFLISILFGAFIVSCDKHSEDPNVTLKEAIVQSETTPISGCKEVTPVILAVDKPKGGNVTCSDVMQAFDNDALICGDKINYDDFATEEGFESAFPSWLNVKVDGIYVSFSMDACAEIEGIKVKVGAVIVKGSNASSVYYYKDGTLSDCGLAAPGNKYMVSNLTFCFIPCDEKFIVSVKSFVEFIDEPGLVASAKSTGTYMFSSYSCIDLGYNYYPPVDPIYLKRSNQSTFHGEVTFEEIFTNEQEPEIEHSLKVIVTYWDVTPVATHLYVGSKSGFTSEMQEDGLCPDYSSDLWLQYRSASKIHTFIIPFSKITVE